MINKISKAVIQHQLNQIQLWFKSTDWIPNKIVTGEWTTDDKRWKDYLECRNHYRKKQDELNESKRSMT